MQNKHEVLTQSIAHREDEIFGYQINIDNYSELLVILPSVWDENLLPYRGADLATLDLSEEDMLMLSELQFRDKITRTLLSERMEQQKAKYVLQVLINNLGKCDV